jgi:putative protease
MSCGQCEKNLEGEPVGKVIHYFDRLGVAIIELAGALKAGDVIRIVGGETDFSQAVESMEVEHQKVLSAKEGDAVGLKVAQKVKDGYKVYRV